MASASNDDGHRLVLPGSITGAEDPTLIGSECRECGNVTFPKRSFCPECLSENVAETELSREGSLVSYTVVHAGGQVGFETPYAFGFVELPEDVRLYSLLTGWESSDDFDVGAPVEVEYGAIKPDEHTGEQLYGHKFRLAAGGDR